ncbi:MAG: V-type ATPase 116kDa subunit family protein [Woeseiaceae bacterium]|nr:V-type ATPase 116kDa subunit family protein [Woeseiaceae bacterium]
MQRATVYLVRDEAPEAALALGRGGVFEPEFCEDDELVSNELGVAYREVYASATNRLAKVCMHLGCARPDVEQSAPRLVPREELESLDDELQLLWQRCSEREQRAQQVRDELRSVEQLEQAIDVYEPLDFDLGMLHDGFRFLDVRIGIVPLTEMNRLREAAALSGFRLADFSRTENAAHILIAGLEGHAGELDRVLSAASFIEVVIPPDFAAHPRRVRRDLEQRRKKMLGEQHEIEAAITADRERYAADLQEASETLRLASAYARMSEATQQRGGLARISGWIPRERSADLEGILSEYLDKRFVVEIRDPLPEERSNVPSALRHPRILQPFAALVQNYGIPRYGEVDPTWVFAVSFIAMFGMMFGDIGHGLVIALGGFAARRKLRGFAPFVVAIGASSMVFGLLYGSIFGYEELIHPVWIAPLSDPALMLRLALYWGIGFVMLMLLIHIRNCLRDGQIGEALLSGTGVAGAAFYLGIIYVAGNWLSTGDVGGIAIAAVLLPLAVILVYQWRHLEATIGEKIIVVFIEGIETLLGFIANTLSFLRVAAFSLNHVALAIAVFTIANMQGPAGHWITVVLGNIFILVLEGAIVTIQVLRLEYYEGFSRFFSGDGREFRPLTMKT